MIDGTSPPWQTSNQPHNLNLMCPFSYIHKSLEASFYFNEMLKCTDVNIEELYAALDLDSLTCLGPGDNQQSCHLDTGRCHLDQLSHAVWVGGGVGTTPATSPGIILIGVQVLVQWCTAWGNIFHRA